MSKRNVAGRLVIENKGVGPVHEKKFFMSIQQAVINGYRIAENTNYMDSTMRNYKGFMGRAVLYKDGVEFIEQAVKEPAPKEVVETPVKVVEEVVETSEVTNEDKLKGLTKKVDLLAFAEELGVEVPEDVNAPTKIKKLIRDTFNK